MPRSAEASDLDAVKNLLRDCSLPTDDFGSSRIELLVDVVAGNVVGTVGLERFGETGLLRSLAIRQEHRGSGRGVRLVDALESLARSQGIAELGLLTQTAKRFFEARGYRVIARGDAPATVQSSAEFQSICPSSAICMAKKLFIEAATSEAACGPCCGKQTGLNLHSGGGIMNDQYAPVAVYGAGGHTGKFVVAELRSRSIPVIAVGRDLSKLPAGVPGRVAKLDHPASLDRAFAGCAVVINCAGPFLDSAEPVVNAALRAGCSYLDVTAEQASAKATLETFDGAARDAGVAVIPAAGFYGGLADLLATALVGEDAVDEITTAVALDRWWPTEGTRKTGERNRVPRVAIEDGQLVPIGLPSASIDWSFAPPHGAQAVIEMPFSEVITISRHLPVRRLHSYLGANALVDVRDASTPTPTAIDAQGRSAQQFAMEVVTVGANGTRRATARGQDIYAVSAPIVAEAAARILASSFKRSGALTLGQAFDAREFLRALTPTHVAVAFDPA